MSHFIAKLSLQNKLRVIIYVVIIFDSQDKATIRYPHLLTNYWMIDVSNTGKSLLVTCEDILEARLNY